MTVLLAACLIALGAYCIGWALGDEHGSRSWKWVPREGAYIVRSHMPVEVERVDKSDPKWVASMELIERLNAYEAALQEASSD